MDFVDVLASFPRPLIDLVQQALRARYLYLPFQRLGWIYINEEILQMNQCLPGVELLSREEAVIQLSDTGRRINRTSVFNGHPYS